MHQRGTGSAGSSKPSRKVAGSTGVFILYSADFLAVTLAGGACSHGLCVTVNACIEGRAIVHTVHTVHDALKANAAFEFALAPCTRFPTGAVCQPREPVWPVPSASCMHASTNLQPQLTQHDSITALRHPGWAIHPA